MGDPLAMLPRARSRSVDDCSWAVFSFTACAVAACELVLGDFRQLVIGRCTAGSAPSRFFPVSIAADFRCSRHFSLRHGQLQHSTVSNGFLRISGVGVAPCG